MDEEVPKNLSQAIKGSLEPKDLIFYFLIIAMVLCSFFSGYLISEKQTIEQANEFFLDYINNLCVCEQEIFVDGKTLRYNIYRHQMNLSDFQLDLTDIVYWNDT